MTTFSTSEPYLEVSEVPDDIISKLDAIIVLGGGVGNAINSPPPYVQDRCERAASIFQRHRLGLDPVQRHGCAVRSLASSRQAGSELH